MSTTWREPQGYQKAGLGKWRTPPAPYDVFMEQQGVPIYRGIGIRRVQDLELAPWERMGGRGAFIQLYGTEGIWGMYLIEVPAGGALNTERHLYEEHYFVVSGRGATEVWTEEGGKRQIFEWQAGSMFAIPLNAHHRIINGSADEPALLMGGTTAPSVMNLFANTDFVFDCPYAFTDRYNQQDDYYKPRLDEIEPDPYRGLAMTRSNLIPDIVNCELPLDNRRSPGYRRIEPNMAGEIFYHWVAQHETGRYSKAHSHVSAAVLICIKGKGYTYTWPRAIGTQPWAAGQSDMVVRQDYEPVGIVSAAPMGGEWFHQHFGISKEPLRLMAWFGPFGKGTNREPGRPGEEVIDKNAMELAEGGSAIGYHEEDPHIRREYEATLEREGAKSRMDDAFYQKP